MRKANTSLSYEKTSTYGPVNALRGKVFCHVLISQAFSPTLTLPLFETLKNNRLVLGAGISPRLRLGLVYPRAGAWGW